MTTGAFISMVIILTAVWGGFITSLVYAMRCEKRKRAARRRT